MHSTLYCLLLRKYILYIPGFPVHKKENVQNNSIDNKQYIKFIFWQNAIITTD